MFRENILKLLKEGNTKKAIETIEKSLKDEIFIVWHIMDIEGQAKDNEEQEGKKLYDESKFPEVLQALKNTHDCNYGVTWETIDCLLDDIALIEE